MYKRGLGYLTFDLARVIASHEINNQKELALTAIDYRFKRVDLEGIRQRMDRSGLSLKEVIEEFKKRQGATTLITTLIGGFFDKKVLDIMKSSKKKKFFIKFLIVQKLKVY